MARHIKNAQCPKCAEAGKDKHKDNLGVFDDESSYCWSCGYRSGASRVVRSSSNVLVPLRGLESSVSLPDDVEPYYPARCVEWLAQYELSINDLYANKCLWSEVLQRLVFPYRESAEGPLLGWQGRSFAGPNYSGPKWWGVGHLDSVYHIFNREQSRDLLVITEDVVSAYKVSKVAGVAAMPLFGSHIAPKRLLRLKLLSDRVLLWLDPDKATEAVKFSHRSNMLGLPMKVVLSDKDPKEHTTEEIKEKLSASN